MFEPVKLADPKNNGIFEDDADGYAAYAVWRGSFVLALRAIIKNGEWASRVDDDAVHKLIARVDPSIPLERVFNTVLADMVERGASWEHLTALAVLAGFETNPFPEHAGNLYMLVADWIVWHDKSRS